MIESFGVNSRQAQGQSFALKSIAEIKSFNRIGQSRPFCHEALDNCMTCAFVEHGLHDTRWDGVMHCVDNQIG